MPICSICLDSMRKIGHKERQRIPLIFNSNFEFNFSPLWIGADQHLSYIQPCWSISLNGETMTHQWRRNIWKSLLDFECHFRGIWSSTRSRSLSLCCAVSIWSILCILVWVIRMVRSTFWGNVFRSLTFYCTSASATNFFSE